MPSRSLVLSELTQPTWVPPTVFNALKHQLEELTYLHRLAEELGALNAHAAVTLAEDTAAAIERIHELMAVNPGMSERERQGYLALIDRTVDANRALLRQLTDLSNARLAAASLPKDSSRHPLLAKMSLSSVEELEPWWR